MSECPFAIALAKQGKKINNIKSKCFNSRVLAVRIANGISETKVLTANYVVYAHKTTDGMYIGMTSDIVKRWREHNQAAFSETSSDFLQPFKSAIRTSNFTHVILGVAPSQKHASDMEAAAIEFYQPSFNVRPEKRIFTNSYGFTSFNVETLPKITISQGARSGSDYSRSDSDRVEIIAEIFTERGRKRLRPITGQSYSTELKIECSRSEREKLNDGDRVKVKVALTTKSNGQKHLVAAKTAVLRKI